MRLLTIPEVAESLGVHRNTAQRLVASGELPSCKIGRARRVRDDDLRAYVEGITVRGMA